MLNLETKKYKLTQVYMNNYYYLSSMLTFLLTFNMEKGFLEKAMV